jgi:hypothetical protein
MRSPTRSSSSSKVYRPENDPRRTITGNSGDRGKKKGRGS